jgi:DNA-binding GntR family transcriptional regulator
VHAEHVAIFEAAIGGKADEAVQLLVQHYTRTATLVASEAREGGHTA